jgi:phosphoribosyl 1,2-cyclic phosphate phosphodiesterase
LRDEPHLTHMNVEEALETVHRLRPRRTLFTHISHRLEHEATSRRLPPGVELAYDGLRISLGLDG